MGTKQCRQCGEVLPVDNFRKYYGGTGRYTICRSCERINSRAKYLTKKGDKASEADKAELGKIVQLSEYQRMCGLKPPRRSKELQSKIEELDEALNKYKGISSEGPAELLRWLSEELTEDPEYYIDTVYEQLLSKYRPVLRVDKEKLVTVYDTTHERLLNRILERFNNYEDTYYQED